MTACKTRKNSKENNSLDTSITSQIDLSSQSVQVVKSKNHDSKKDNSDQKLDSFADQDDLYVLTFDESESRIIFLFFILFGVLTMFSFSFMTIIHLITLEELPVQVQPNPSFKTKGSKQIAQWLK